MIKENVSLKNHNTFGIDVKTKFLVEIFSEGELLKILKSKIKGNADMGLVSRIVKENLA